MDIREFLFWEGSSRDTIDFKKIYVDVADDLISGLLLSQIVYWHLPSRETGKTKLRVFKEGQYWLAKERGDWHEECRISPKQYDRAIKVLEKKEIVELKKFKFNGMPMIHIRLIWENFLFLLENLKKNEVDPYSPMGIPQTVIPESPKGENGNSPKGNSGIDLSGILLTENTDIDYLTENTNKDLKKNVNNETNPFGKKGLKKIAMDYYPTFAPGRWSKERYIELVDKMVNELMNGQEIFSRAENPYGYIKGCLKKMASHHDYNQGLTEVKTDPSLPYFDWLRE
jgi:hypothetical protein